MAKTHVVGPQGVILGRRPKVEELVPIFGPAETSALAEPTRVRKPTSPQDGLLRVDLIIGPRSAYECPCRSPDAPTSVRLLREKISHW